MLCVYVFFIYLLYVYVNIVVPCEDIVYICNHLPTPQTSSSLAHSTRRVLFLFNEFRSIGWKSILNHYGAVYG